MKILKCELLADRDKLNESMNVCRKKYDTKPKKMSNKKMKNAIISEHGSLNKMIFNIVALVPDRVHTHLRTHYLVNQLYQCSFSRPDLGSDDGKTRLIAFYLPVKRMLEMFELRRCNRSWKDTIQFFKLLNDEVVKLEKQFEGLLVTRCVKRGYCCEGKKNCGLIDTPHYDKLRVDFLNIVEGVKDNHKGIIIVEDGFINKVGVPLLNELNAMGNSKVLDMLKP